MDRTVPWFSGPRDSSVDSGHTSSVLLQSFRLGAKEPIREPYCSDQFVAIGNECTLWHLAPEVAQARVGDDVARVVPRLQELSCQVIELPLFRPGHVDVAVPWSLERDLRHRTRYVIRGERLHEHVREANGLSIGPGIREAADELEELVLRARSCTEYPQP